MLHYSKFVFGLVLFSKLAFSAECTSQWDYYFDTDPLHAKVFSGDTSTGYAVFSFMGNKNIKFMLKGRFPKTRFMSLETQDTRLSLSEDALFDFMIEPDPGSENPFREGVSIDSEKRDFTVYLSQKKETGAVNTVKLPTSILQHSVMLRFYSPNRGVKLSKEDLPKIYALDAVTGREVSCPKTSNYPVIWHLPQFLAVAYTKIKPDFKFTLAGATSLAGLNKAASYLFAVTPMKREEVALVRFKAPTFTNTQDGTGLFQIRDDVRYWSLCTSNFPNNITLNCLPDHLSTPLSDGYVYVVVGGGEDVKQEALRRGYNYLPDARKSNQKVMGFVYRNLVPTEAFKKTSLYQGEYIPSAKKCSSEGFVSGSCGLE